MFKEYLVENGSNLIFWMCDVLSPDNTTDVCTSNKCAEVLADIIIHKSFECISEEQSELVFKDFIEPVTYKDIDIVAKDAFYTDVYNECVKLWSSAPPEIRNTVYGNK